MLTKINPTARESSATSHPSSGPHDACSERPRVIVIGSALSSVHLRHMLAATNPSPVILSTLTAEIAPYTQTDSEDSLPELPLIGKLSHVLEAHHPVDLVLVSVPMAMWWILRQVAAHLDQVGVDWRFMPTLADQLAGRIKPILSHENRDDEPSEDEALISRSEHDRTPQMMTVRGQMPWDNDAARLLERRPKPLDATLIRRSLQGRCVLITGAGGSIGGELARMVSRFNPAKLVLVERSENALFEIDRDIATTFPNLARTAVLHDVTDAVGTYSIVRDHQPGVIFHAAAHKHVPMMEDHPAQAVENNFFGTRHIADAAAQAGVERFVMISTDKAVNPSSIMGATKRLAELYVQHLDARSGCVFSMVRFGNVLGSACSVLPIWTRQLAQGKPITVTHPEMHRYFMTIPEAAGLVLQSAAFAQGGEVFLLDMGQPLRILDLARRFLRTQGLEPNVDVPIRFTGARPGEKLHEQLAYEGEDMLPTPHESVHIWRTTQPGLKRVKQIIAVFDRLRIQDNPGVNPWHGVGREAIAASLRWAIPEMVQAAAG